MRQCPRKSLIDWQNISLSEAIVLYKVIIVRKGEFMKTLVLALGILKKENLGLVRGEGTLIVKL